MVSLSTPVALRCARSSISRKLEGTGLTYIAQDHRAPFFGSIPPVWHIRRIAKPVLALREPIPARPLASILPLNRARIARDRRHIHRHARGVDVGDL